MYRYLSITMVVLSVAFSSPTLVEDINSFSQTKAAAIKIHADAPSTSHCGYRVNWQGKKGVVNLQSRGYQVRKNGNRTSRVEREHVVPAWQFGHQRQCWRDGGCKSCAKNPVYRKMENNMHNLQPSVDEMNGDRGSSIYSQWGDGEGQYGQCVMKVDFEGKAAEPPARVRGVVACIYFYVYDQYNLTLSRQQVQLLNARNKMYLVTGWECERDERITKVQGNHNPYM